MTESHHLGVLEPSVCHSYHIEGREVIKPQREAKTTNPQGLA